MEIKLFESQFDHVNRLLNIFKTSKIALDFSIMGTGKTYTSSYISSLFNFDEVIIICPLSVKNKWLYMKDTYKLKSNYILSFTSLRSTKGHDPSHGLLIRNELNNSKTPIDEFEITDKYKTLIDNSKNGIFIIIDEIQYIKNINSQFNACKKLIQYILNSPHHNKSKILLLSGSPIDKLEQVTNLLKMIGIIKHNELSKYSPVTGETEWKGFKDVLTYSRRLDIDLYNTIKLPQIGTGKVDKLILIIYEIFQLIIKKHIVSSMLPLKNEYNVIKYNGYFNITNDTDKQQLITQVNKLSSSCYTKDNIFFVNGIETLKQIQQSLQLIELAKINDISRIATEYCNLNRKVVICLNYTKSIENIHKILTQNLPDINILLLDGSTKIKDRNTIINKFQQNDLQFPLLISNLQVCSTGIDLDDKFGNIQRICLVNPNYSTITLYQLSHRFYRHDTKSTSFIYFFFSKDANELSILKALSEKSSIMKSITHEQAENGVIFPCDYSTFVEPN